MNKICKILLLSFFFFSTLIADDNSYKIYTNIKELPTKKAALILGTAKYVKKGKINYFYKYRIDAIVELWKAKKINAIVVSGDKSAHYDEVTTMYKDLVKRGIPGKYITKDFHGHRTFDSIVRASEIFDLDDYIIVSQEFHLKKGTLSCKR